jgi:hypothetical protein
VDTFITFGSPKTLEHERSLDLCHFIDEFKGKPITKEPDLLTNWEGAFHHG